MFIKTLEVNTDSAQLATADTRLAGKVRMLYIDNIRTVLISLVVLIHLAATYGFGGDWYYYEVGEVSPISYFILLPLQAIGAAFAMGLFFMLAGYFTPGAFDRKGPAGFLTDRFKRLGIPWALYEICINPIIYYSIALHKNEYQGTFWQYLRSYIDGLSSFGDGPVWFLEALLIFSIFYAAWRVLTPKTPREPRNQAPKANTPPGKRSIALFALMMGLSTFVIRIWAPFGRYYEPWHLELAHFPQYILMFTTGILAYRRNWTIETFKNQAKTWRWWTLILAIGLPVLALASGALTGSLDERGAGGFNWLSLLYSIWEGFMCVAMSITVLDWFSKRFNQQGRFARVLSENCFGVYILHPIVIVPLALALSDIRMNLSLEFLLVAPLAMTLSYLVVYYARKLPLLEAIL